MNKFIKIFLLVVLVLILAIAITLSQFYFNESEQIDSGNSTNNLENNQQQISKKDLDKSIYPDRLPVDLPIEAGAVIEQNYIAENKDGQYQATRVYETSLELVTVLNNYKDYLNKNNWTIETTVNNENYKMLFAKLRNGQLQVSIDLNSETKVKTVSLIYTENK